MNKNQQQQQQDSVYYYKPGQFKDFIQRISDKYKSLLVSDVLQTFREISCLASKFKQITFDVDLIGCINSTPSIDGGESYFQGGHYEWFDNSKDEMLMTASSVRGILSNCGFSSYYWEQNKSKRRVPCVFYINLICPVLDWLGSAGKTHIDLQPFASDIAKTVSSVAYKMPTFR